MSQKSFGQLVRIAAFLMMGLASAIPAHALQGSPAASASVTGRTATAVVLSNGQLRQFDENNWIQTDASGEGIARFNEIKRDDNSIYLVNQALGEKLQLDIRARKAVSTDSVSRRRTSLDILSATAVPVPTRSSGIQSLEDRNAGPLSARRCISVSRSHLAKAFAISSAD